MCEQNVWDVGLWPSTNSDLSWMHSIEGQSGYGAAIPPQRLKTVPVPDEPGPAPALVIALTSGLDRVSLDESYIDVATDCKEFCWNFFIPTGALAMHWPATLPELLTCLRSIESFWFVLGGCAPARPWKTRIDSHHRCHASSDIPSNRLRDFQAKRSGKQY